MILHIVFIRFKNALQQDEKQALYEGVAALKNVTPGIVDVKYGPNVSSEGLNGGFLDGFVVTFESPEARDAYLVHPEHIAVAEKLVAAADGGLSGLIVFDMAA
ncbi:Dabb family protein [Neorhizobium alkalisoli]|uniref:Stress responsive alpha/beta barrel protein n=1 Tax=Neorhizobium alkalisoli TaxID=528178 RepID=A0A561R3P5_9HYPH|nr:Dabb family protein [Neorhizobium alkalisoli]TWF57203.1 stress responsive alpha/beta barrel protein [Neorhizobium alkalisoli]